MGNLERDQEELLVTCKCLRWNLRYFDIDISLDIFDIYDWYNGLERCARLTCIPGETWLFRNPDIRDRPIIGFMLGGPPSAGWAWKQVGACLGFFRTFEINSARFFFEISARFGWCEVLYTFLFCRHGKFLVGSQHEESNFDGIWICSQFEVLQAWWIVSLPTGTSRRLMNKAYVLV